MTCLMRAAGVKLEEQQYAQEDFLRDGCLAVKHQNMPAVTRLSHEGRVCMMRREQMDSRSRHDGTCSLYMGPLQGFIVGV